MSEILESVERLTKDLKAAAVTLSDTEARFLVDYYYMAQENRKRTDNQVRALNTSGEPHAVIAWLAKQDATLEKQVARALGAYVENRGPAAAWCLSQVGIGPIITAGLFAHIDIEKAPTAGHIWAFAGLTGRVWEKGQRRPWNAALKTLVWKLTESMVKVSGNPEAYYGQIYVERKAKEIERNESGELKDQAAAALAARNFGKETKAREFYEKGMLPPAHVHARAKRWTGKLFLSHMHEVMYFVHFGRLPPRPYAIEHLGHAHYLSPPGVEIVPGMGEALRRQYPMG